MAVVYLDLNRLLGFKIVANGDAAATLRSPKIGGKQCPNIDMVDASVAEPAAIRIKIGTKGA